MSVLTTALNPLWRNFRYTFARPRTVRREVLKPLKKQLDKFRTKSLAAGNQHLSEAYLLGLGTPLRAARVVNKYARQEKLDPQKAASLKATARLLTIHGWLTKVVKTAFVYTLFQLVSLSLSLFPGLAPVKQKSFEEQHFPPPLALVLPNEEIMLYGNNDWNPLLRKHCASYFEFSASNRLTETQFNYCLENNPQLSVDSENLISYFRSLKNNTIILTPEEIRQGDQIFSAITKAPKMKLQTVSTASKTKAASILSKIAEKNDFASRYAQAYNAPAVSLSKFPQTADILMIPNPLNSLSRLPAKIKPLIYQVVTKDQSGAIEKVSYVPLDPNAALAMGSLSDFSGGVAFAKQFDQEIENDARLLFQYHSAELSLAQIKFLLKGKLLLQLQGLQHEDPWQDIGACRWAGCHHLQALEQAFAGSKYGIKFLGLTFRPPWRLASYFIPMEQQGFGPYQLIFGLFKEAAEDQTIRGHFASYLTEADLANDQAMMRAILDKPTISCAFIYDFILSRLKTTVFSNPEIRLPPNFPLYISDYKLARQLALMGAAVELMHNPELAEIAESAAFVSSPFFNWLSLYADLLDDRSFLSGGTFHRALLTAQQNNREYHIAAYYFGPAPAN